MKEKTKGITEDKAVIKAAEAVFKSMAYEQTVRDIVYPKQKEVIAFYKFQTAQEWTDRGMTPKQITEPKDMYLAEKEDFDLYLREMQDFYKEAGFNVKPDRCPLLIAESTTREAKNLLIEVCEPYTGISFDDLMHNFKYYDQYIDLTLRLMSNYVNPKV